MRRSITVIDSLGRSLANFEAWVTRIPRTAFVAVVFALAFVRNGFDLFDLDWAVTGSAIERLPEAVNYISWSWGNLLIAKLLGVQDQNTWYALHVALTVVALFLPLIAARRLHRPEFHTFAVYWFLLPVVGSLLMWIGMYDVISVIGAVTIALSRSWWQAALGAVIMSAGNPEQAIIAAGAFLVVAHHTNLRAHRSPAWVAFVVSLIAFAGSRFLIAGDSTDDRSDLLRSPLESFELLVLNWPSSIWGWNGIVWLFVIAVFVVSSWKDRGLLALGLLLIPAAAVFVTYDWDRVYWLVTTASLVALGCRFAQSHLSSSLRGGVLALALISLIIIPTKSGGTFFLISTIGQIFACATEVAFLMSWSTSLHSRL